MLAQDGALLVRGGGGGGAVRGGCGRRWRGMCRVSGALLEFGANFSSRPWRRIAQLAKKLNERYSAETGVWDEARTGTQVRNLKKERLLAATPTTTPAAAARVKLQVVIHKVVHVNFVPVNCWQPWWCNTRSLSRWDWQYQSLGIPAHV